MPVSLSKRIAAGLFCVLVPALSVAADGTGAMPAGDAHWIGAWAAAPSSPGPSYQAQSIRQVVRAGMDGSRLRLRFSNLFGTGPMTIGPVQVARHAGGAAIEAGSGHAVSFGGKPTALIAKGESVLSDPVEMPVSAFDSLAVSLYVPAGSATSTVHDLAIQTAYFAPGNVVSAQTFPAGETDTSRFFLTDVEVVAAPGARALVAVGDSITDGVGSTLDANARWPDALAARFKADPRLASVAVLNAGIAGNRILNDAADPYLGPKILSRFDRDALDKPGVRWVVLLSGSNDISAAERLKTPEANVSAEQIIEGMKTLIARAHAKGVKVVGATLVPKGSPDEPLTPAASAKRRALNAWIRDGGAFDAVVDFERALRDPARPEYMLPAFDSGDHVHPNDAGYKAMAASFDLDLFAAD
ncbi:MAG TPA: SGNH/GDSL hydrolase family protein [Luteimonas sp.]|nr:SGNH/GDSL hydrolase family protein [Luteimonas sp.]